MGIAGLEEEEVEALNLPYCVPLVIPLRKHQDPMREKDSSCLSQSQGGSEHGQGWQWATQQLQALLQVDHMYFVGRAEEVQEAIRQVALQATPCPTREAGGEESQNSTEGDGVASDRTICLGEDSGTAKRWAGEQGTAM